MGLLNTIRAHLECAFIDVSRQRRPPRQRVADRLGKTALTANPGDLGVEIRFQPIQPRLGVFLPRSGAQVWGSAPDMTFNGEQGCDLFQDLKCDR